MEDVKLSLPLPTHEEVLVCNPQTTAEEVFTAVFTYFQGSNMYQISARLLVNRMWCPMCA